MPKQSSYSVQTGVPLLTDNIEMVSGGNTLNFPVQAVIRQYCVSVGPAGSFSDYICDGTADNVEIQAAVNQVNAAGGGAVYVRAGTYNLGADISLKNISNVLIQGQGVGVTIFQNHGFRKNDTATTSNMDFRDFTVDVNSNSNQAMNFNNNSYFFHMQRVELKNATANFLLQWGAVDRLIVEDCYFYDGGLTTGQDNCAGGQLVTTNNTTIFRNNWFVKEHSAGGGLLTTGQTGNLLVLGNSFVDLSNNSYMAVSCEQQTGDSLSVQIIGNKTYRVGFQFGVSSNSHRVARGVIMGNIIEGVAGANTASGITTQRVDNLLVADNSIENVSYGIFSSANGYAKISNNKIKNTDTASSGFPSDKAGIYLTGNTYVDAQHNTIWDDQNVATTPYGIRVVGGTGNVYLNNNHTLGAFTTNALQVTSTQTMLDMNNNDFSGGTISLGTITNLRSTNNAGINPSTTSNLGNISGTVTFTRVNGSHITAMLIGNVTTLITNGLVKGERLILELTQDATGNRTVSKPANVKLVGGAFSPTASANATDVWQLEWDGSNWVEVSRSLNVN